MRPQISIFPVVPPTESDLGSSTTDPISSTSGGEFAEFIGGEELTFVRTSPDLDIVEGSGEGEGSGSFEFEPFPDPNFHYNFKLESESTVFPYYDEFVSTPNLFDFNAQPNMTQNRLCRCPDGNESTEDRCSFSNSSSVITIDETLKLAFCSVPQHHPRCIGRRNLIRIIGQVHQSGEAIKSVLDTAVFCDCPNGFRRIGIEPWEGNYAFKYQCK
uniref:Uncharacterized protein n=1 Tax=Panagrolaimus sp. JU765 TaxID=591449 RepID=A0AC34QKE5_9BILA